MTSTVRLGEVDAFPQGRGVSVEVGDLRIAVFRIDDAFHAIGDLCSHAEASLAEGEVFEGEVECPRHGAEFSLTTGEPSSLPATAAVPVYEINVVDGDVMLVIREEQL
ncbi:MAG: Rieske 2Fe-2S domain-containing protein [Acidobacteria bacterium]|nr:Rieske 2Fe-2S domain-containing protein [Acidobacteriota bacterium]